LDFKCWPSCSLPLSALELGLSLDNGTDDNGVLCRVIEGGLEEFVLCLFFTLLVHFRGLHYLVACVVFVKIFINNTSLMILKSGELSGYYSKGSVHGCR
jgi:hypothetical protein